MPAEPFLTLAELYVGDIAQNGNWVVACVRSNVGWPKKLTDVMYRGRTLYLLPVATNAQPSMTFYPAVALRLGAREQFRNGQVLISYFLSALAWSQRQPIEVLNWTGGNIPRSLGGYSGGTMMTT
jgi:hypothetical protein